MFVFIKKDIQMFLMRTAGRCRGSKVKRPDGGSMEGGMHQQRAALQTAASPPAASQVKGPATGRP